MTRELKACEGGRFGSYNHFEPEVKDISAWLREHPEAAWKLVVDMSGWLAGTNEHGRRIVISFDEPVTLNSLPGTATDAELQEAGYIFVESE